MKYDFETILDREGKDSIAADVIPVEGAHVKEGFSKIPMWVADMNFKTAPSVTEAIAERIQFPVFGYFFPSKEYNESIIRWQKERNGVTDLKEENIGYENGVLGGVISALQAFCSAGDYVLLHSPTYIGFTNSIENNGYKIVHSELVRDENGVWRMDYEDMDRKLKQYHIHAAVFCSPHNPCGRVWERWEIEKAMEVYEKNNCLVISDEIWSDLILEGYTHIPTQSVSEWAKQHVVAMYAPSKTFNLAGLVGSYHIIYNEYIHDRIKKQSSLSHYNSMNVLSMHALAGAYRPEGAEWVDELRSVLTKNAEYAYNYICEHFKGVTVAKPQGTYMLYLDCTEWCREHDMSMDELLKAGIEVGVIWQDGRPFHHPWAIRMNLALPSSMVQDAFSRLEKYVFCRKE